MSNRYEKPFIRIDFNIKAYPTKGLDSVDDIDFSIGSVKPPIVPNEIRPYNFKSSRFGAKQKISPKEFSKRYVFVDLSFDRIGEAPPASSVDFSFVDRNAPVGEDQTIFHGSVDGLSVGLAYVWNTRQYVVTTSFDAQTTGTPSLRNSTRYISAKGYDASNFGRPLLKNFNQNVYPSGPFTQLMGSAIAYNLTQYRTMRGFDASLYGKPYMQGGVKYLNVSGFDSLKHGVTIAFNTTANREIKPAGINSLVITKPDVSPRIIYPIGMYQLDVGTHHIYDPAIKPLGLAHTAYGEATVWYHTRPIIPVGLPSFSTGYPTVFDPTQEVQVPSVITSAIFGDVQVKNDRKVLEPTSIFSEVVEQWAVISNKNRYLSLKGLLSQSFGDSAINNNTPSVFFNGIDSLNMGLTAIGYAVRTIGPSGFDELRLGRATLTKSPELAPKSFNGSVVSSLFISHRIRSIKPPGYEPSIFGSHTTWYRYRELGTKSWASSSFGQSQLTHGLREVIAKGFVRDAYGMAWVSQGTRHIEPAGIYKIHPSLHMVGGSREIKPVGYIATLFGTRIIPESASIQPQGFLGSFGLADVRLDTRYLGAIGFISVGQQPADRWGDTTKAYNLTQYIVQEYDSRNGLNPPDWSAWTLIENRDKQLNTTGLNSQKFGYSKIDNAATPLLPTGIAPPIGTKYDVSMIAHGMRYIKPDGLEAPIVSSWLVAYNDARVISLDGFVETKTGLASAENTRRYYSGVGRFESLVAGVPMISHAIRHILLEPRYAIMPPQINLPVIDTWTKYATFRGFETAAYGTPSLSITFNIIAPKWAHRNNVGDPYAKNLTPELGLYGHDSSEFGLAAVRTQWRKLDAIGDTLTLFGLSKIADTKQVIDIRGWRSTVSAQKHTVIRTGAPPYSQQIISLDGGYDYEKDEPIKGYGIEFDERRLGVRIPKPSLNQNVVYPQGYEATVFGGNRVWSNNIQILAGIAIHNISANTVVINKTRQIILGESDAIKSEVKLGEPRMSPWTIYAVNEAPAQARQNHQYQRTHYVNSDFGNRAPGIVVGTPRVDSSIRHIKPVWYINSRVGEPKADLVRREIKPRSFGVTKVGQPSIPFTDQTIAVYHTKKDPSSVFGLHALRIADTGLKYVKPAGISSFVVGNNEVQLRTREVLAKGKDSLAMGTRKDYDKPYMWQGLRVGAHVPLVIGGTDTSAFGETMVSLRIREVVLNGWDSFISEYDTSNFNSRMRVAHARLPIPQSQRVSVLAFTSSNFGRSTLRFGQHFIKPDGNADQFRKSSYSAEFGAPTISG